MSEIYKLPASVKSVSISKVNLVNLCPKVAAESVPCSSDRKLLEQHARVSRSGRLIKPNSLVNFSPELTYKERNETPVKRETSGLLPGLEEKREIEVPSYRIMNVSEEEEEGEDEIRTQPLDDMSEAAFLKRHQKYEAQEKRVVKRYRQHVNAKQKLASLKARLSDKEERRLDRFKSKNQAKKTISLASSSQAYPPPQLSDIIAIECGAEAVPPESIYFPIGPEVKLNEPLPDHSHLLY